MSLAYYLHNLDPVIFRLGFFEPRWYGFAYLMAFVCAYFLVTRLARIGMLRMPVERVPDLVLNCCIFGVLLGGRLGFVLFYEPSLLTTFHTVELFGMSLPMWGPLEVWRGGMSAHGGVVFTILTIIIFCRKNRFPILNVGDAACMVVPLGLMFGRIANFINGELYGHVTYNTPWAVQFPSELLSPTNNRFWLPAATRDALIQKVAEHESVFRNYWNSLALDPDAYSKAMGRLIDMAHHGNRYVLEQFSAVLPPRHPSQLYEALLEGLLLFVICWSIGWLWRKDGMASGAFLTFYPVMRIIGEQFRVGDTPQMIFGVPVSLGVLYSVPMFLIGLGFWLYFIRTSKPNVWVPQAAPPAKPEAAKNP